MGFQDFLSWLAADGFDCFFGIIVGMGAGAYNAESLKPCTDGTLHVLKKHGKKGGDKVKAAAAPHAEVYYNKAKAHYDEKLAPHVDKGVAAYNKTKETVAPYIAKAAPYVQKAHETSMPYIRKASNKVAEAGTYAYNRATAPKPAK